MTVKELKEMLNKYPDDMLVANARCSDYQVISEDEWSVEKCVDNGGNWLMRSHETMSKENQLKEKEYLCLEGN